MKYLIQLLQFSMKDRFRLKHIIEAIESINKFIENRDKHDLYMDDMLQSAVARKFEIIGEAANQVTEETKLQYPEVPWKEAISMRNKMIHEYFGIDYEYLWDTAKNDLPNFKSLIEKILTEIS